MSKETLFEPKDVNTLIEEAATLEGTAQGSETTATTNIACKSRDLIAKLNNCIASGSTHINFVSAGELSLHKLIEFIFSLHLDKSADLWLSTWAIKEAAARSLLKLKEGPQLQSLFGVFDYRIKSLDGKSFQLIENEFKTFALTKNHAKVIVIDFFDFQYTILTSANLSNNPRIEAGYVSKDSVTAHFHMGWMKKVLNGQKVY